jgi:hypothetical protein
LACLAYNQRRCRRDACGKTGETLGVTSNANL